MRFTARALLVASLWLSVGAGFSQTSPALRSGKSDDSLLQKFSDFNLPAAADAADLRLRRAPKDTLALFVRMETAELQERPAMVLDSALRLCALHAASDVQEVASNRVLQRAANSWIFNAALRRIKSAAAIQNGCTFNLRLALAAAASDGADIDLDMAAHSSGLLTRWRIAGPFGRYNNVDFDHRWTPETERFLREQYSPERDYAAVKNEYRGSANAKAGPSRAIVPERFW